MTEIVNWYDYLDVVPEELRNLVESAVMLEDELKAIENLCEVEYFPPISKINRIETLTDSIIRDIHYLANLRHKDIDKEFRKIIDKTIDKMQNQVSQYLSDIRTAIENRDIKKLRGALGIFNRVLYSFLEGILRTIKIKSRVEIKKIMTNVVINRLIMAPEEEEEKKGGE